jgi:hypothetical protein
MRTKTLFLFVAVLAFPVLSFGQSDETFLIKLDSLNSSQYSISYTGGLGSCSKVYDLDRSQPIGDSSYHGLRTDSYINVYDDYDKGGKRSEITYKHGFLHGPVRIYSYGGSLYCEGEMEANRKSGLWKFYKNGALWQEGNYDSEKDSSFLRYDCNIRPFQHAQYFLYGADTARNDEMGNPGLNPWLNIVDLKEIGRVGTWKFYDKEGKVEKEVQYGEKARKSKSNY